MVVVVVGGEGWGQRQFLQCVKNNSFGSRGFFDGPKSFGKRVLFVLKTLSGHSRDHDVKSEFFLSHC